jgi:glucokinase
VRAATLLAMAGGDPLAIKGPHVTQAAKEGDELSIELLTDLGRAIGLGCASVAAVLDPEVFVIGGGVIAAGDLMLEPAREAFSKHLTASGHRPLPPILAADMANDAGIVGAAALAREAVPLEY